MHEWIALDGVKSTTIPGLAVLAYTPPLLAPRSREETVIAGRLTALTQRDWQREPADLEITLALVGESMQAMLINGSFLRKPDAARDIAHATMRLAAHPASASDPTRRKRFLHFYWGKKPAHIR